MATIKEYRFLETRSKAIQDFIVYVRENTPEEIGMLEFMHNMYTHWLKSERDKIDIVDKNTMSLFKEA